MNQRFLVAPIVLAVSLLAVGSLSVLPGCGPAPSTTGPTPEISPTPSVSASATPAPSPSGSATPAPSPSASATPAPSPSASATPTPSPSPSATPSATPAPSPSATPASARTVLSSGPFSEAAPGAAFVASNSLFVFQVTEAGRLDARASWPSSAQVRLYIYAGSCSASQAEASQCGTPVGASLASASPATLSNLSVSAGFFTIRLENAGPGDTGPGQWEVGLTR